jgi:hypothetical protein
MMTTTKRTGSVRWIKEVRHGQTTAKVRITSETKAGPVSHEYDVWPTFDNEGRVPYVRLVSEGGKVYHVDLAAGHCDCPAHQFRGNACKHLRGMTSALSHLNLL